MEYEVEVVPVAVPPSVATELVDTNSARHLAVHVAFQCIIKFGGISVCVSKL